MSLRNMERFMVLKLRDLSRDPPVTRDVKLLNRGRSVVRRCRVNRLKYWGHINRRRPGHVLRTAMNYRISGKLKRGRPCFTWNDALARDLRRAGDQKWENTLSDASAHSAKCNGLYQHSDTDELDY